MAGCDNPLVLMSSISWELALGNWIDGTSLL